MQRFLLCTLRGATTASITASSQTVSYIVEKFMLPKCYSKCDPILS